MRVTSWRVVEGGLAEIEEKGQPSLLAGLDWLDLDLGLHWLELAAWLAYYRPILRVTPPYSQSDSNGSGYGGGKW